MDFLTQQEVSGFKQDLKNAQAKQEVERMSFEKKLCETYAAEIKEMRENPEKFFEKIKFNDKFAKKYTRKQRWQTFKENLRKFFGLK